ncbi:MAG: metallopeptidase [Planctomycetota bacterium]
MTSQTVLTRRSVVALFMACFAVCAGVLLSSAKPAEEKKGGKFYDPIEMNVEGWTIKVDPKLLKKENADTKERAFEALANHLQRVKYIVSEERVKELQKLPIWIELNNPVLGNMQYHPGRGWLIRNGHDPRLVNHVHIPRARNLYSRSQWAKHPYVVLHELAHSYHDQVLSFDHPDIVGAFKEAKKNGIYDKVLAHSGRMVRHYSLSNEKEYFAESTEAYFGVNDFYPFVRAELKQHDPRMYGVMEKIWGRIR